MNTEDTEKKVPQFIPAEDDIVEISTEEMRAEKVPTFCAKVTEVDLEAHTITVKRFDLGEAPDPIAFYDIVSIDDLDKNKLLKEYRAWVEGDVEMALEEATEVPYAPRKTFVGRYVLGGGVVLCIGLLYYFAG